MDLKGKKIASLVDNHYQEMEVWYPYFRLKEAGAECVMVGCEAGKTYSSKLGYPAKADKAYDHVNANDFDGVVVPGGYASSSSFTGPITAAYLSAPGSTSRSM